jgi:biopolymer transport protein ExbD
MKRRNFGAPEITPLIDVVFLLLIFFLVSSVFKKEEPALEVRLPESRSVKTVTEKKELKIEMTTEKVAINGRPCTMDALDDRLAHFGDKTLPVVLYIDEKVPYKRVMSLLDLLQKNGLLNVDLVSEAAPKP